MNSNLKRLIKLAGIAAFGVSVATAATPIATATATTAVASKITLTTSNANARYGAAGKITATVRAVAASTLIPTGSVDFAVDGSWYWTSMLDANGKATLALADLYPSLYPGTYTITATYSGDQVYDTAQSGPLLQTIVGSTAPAITTITMNSKNRPVFSPRSFTMSSVSPMGCNVTITNNTPATQILVYGTPGAWKRLPFGAIAPGASTGVGVGIGGYTGYFSTMANTSNYVAIHCR